MKALKVWLVLSIMSSRSSAYHACYVLFCRGLAENIDAMGKVQKMYKLPESFGWISADATVNALERLGVFSSSNPAGLVELSERLEMRETHKKIKKIVKKNYEKIPKFLFTSYSELHHSADLQGLVKQTHVIIKKLCAQVELAEIIIKTRNMGRKCGPETKGLLENFNQAHDKVKELDRYVTQAVRMLQLEEQEGIIILFFYFKATIHYATKLNCNKAVTKLKQLCSTLVNITTLLQFSVAHCKK